MRPERDILTSLIFALTLSGCIDPIEKKSIVDRIMPLGVIAQNPSLNLTADGAETSIEIVVAAPKQAQIEASLIPEYIYDSGSWAQIGLERRESYAGLDIAYIPIDLSMDVALQDNGYESPMTLGYAVKLKSAGVEKWVVGYLAVTPDFKLTVVDTNMIRNFRTPKQAIRGQQVPLELESDAPGNYRVHWFVSDGELKEPTSHQTMWRAPDKEGVFTVVGVYRAMGLQGIDLRVQDVEVR